MCDLARELFFGSPVTHYVVLTKREIDLSTRSL